MEPQKSTSAAKVLWTLSILVILVLLVFFAFSNASFLKNLRGSLEGNTSQVVSQFTTSQNFSVNNGNFVIVYPPDNNTLINYALNLINSDRHSANFSLVVLSPVASAQQHSYSMLQNSYFSHWDTQGLKPYMRYTLLNGTGFVDENVAYEQTTIPSFLSTSNVEQAISELESKMIHDDLTCCNNGHRDNILSPYHNRVSFGISYDSTHVYFVEDFENHYAELKIPIIYSGNNVVLKGNTTERLNPISVAIFHDKTPRSLNASVLNSKYNGPYSQGNFTGGVLPCTNSILQGCSQYPGYVTVYASTWEVSSNTIDIDFSLSDFIKSYGNGVYTIYLEQGSQDSPEFLTSISIFVS